MTTEAAARFGNQSPGFRFYLKEGLLETLTFCLMLGLTASIVLLIYGNNFDDTGEIVAISIIFFGFLGLSVKSVGALSYHLL